MELKLQQTVLTGTASFLAVLMIILVLIVRFDGYPFEGGNMAWSLELSRMGTYHREVAQFGLYGASYPSILASTDGMHVLYSECAGSDSGCQACLMAGQETLRHVDVVYWLSLLMGLLSLCLTRTDSRYFKGVLLICGCLNCAFMALAVGSWRTCSSSMAMYNHDYVSAGPALHCLAIAFVCCVTSTIIHLTTSKSESLEAPDTFLPTKSMTPPVPTELILWKKDSDQKLLVGHVVNHHPHLFSLGSPGR